MTKCPICGSEIIVQWVDHPYTWMHTNDMQICKWYIVKCSNPECRPLKVNVDGEEEYTYAVMSGPIFYSRNCDKDELDRYIQYTERDLKEGLAKKIEELKEVEE